MEEDKNPLQSGTFKHACRQTDRLEGFFPASN
jgi:hypothetical protein